jgi:hypothetical protein
MGKKNVIKEVGQYDKNNISGTEITSKAEGKQNVTSTVANEPLQRYRTFAKTLPETKVETPVEQTAQKSVKDIVGEYINSSNTSKASLAGSSLDQYKNIQDNALNAKNEAYQAQMNAMKYSENAMKQMGLNNTGLVGTNAQNISNNYMNAINLANATKMNNERELLDSYRKELAGIEDKEANALKESSAIKKAEAIELLPNYMNNQEALNEYMAELENDATISDADKDFIKRYVKTLELAKGEETALDEPTIKANREELLSDVKGYVSSGKVGQIKLSEEQNNKLKEYYEALRNTTDSIKAEKLEKEINDYIEELEYNDKYKEEKTTTQIKEDVINSNGDGTERSPYTPNITYEELKEGIKYGSIPAGTHISIYREEEDRRITYVVSQGLSGKWKLVRTGNNVQP